MGTADKECRSQRAEAILAADRWEEKYHQFLVQPDDQYKRCSLEKGGDVRFKAKN